MAEMKFYIKALGLSEDEDGNPDYGVMEVNLGEFKTGMEIPYEELIKDKDPILFINAFIPDVFKLTDVQFITPEEYERDY